MNYGEAAITVVAVLFMKYAFGAKNLISVEETTAIANPVFLNASFQPYIAAAGVEDAQRQGRKQLTILTAVTYDSSTGPICTKSMEVALDRLRSTNNWLPDYEVYLELINDQYDEAHLVEPLARELKDNENNMLRLPLFLTDNFSPLSQRISGYLIKQHDFISFTTLQNELGYHTNRKRFSSSFTLGENAYATYPAILDFCERMGWRKVAIYAEIIDYFDSVERQYVPFIEHDRNMTLLWMGKVSYFSEDSVEIADAFEQMKAYDPRVIILDINSAVNFACWAYKYGMYGPNYVFFNQWYSFFDPTTVELPKAFAWCTREMISTVYESYFWHGDDVIPTLFGENYTDSTGWRYSDFQQELGNRLIDAQTSPSYGYWPPICYDEALYIGAFVNATETLLRSRNSTLSEWTTGSENFKEKSREFHAIMEEVLYSLPVNGFKAVYDFERETTRNTGGFTPFTISQIQDGFPVMVAYYKSNEKVPLTLYTSDLVWKTVDGRPPKDSVTIHMTEQSLFKEAVFIAFVTIGAIGEALCLLIAISAFVLNAMKLRLRILLKLIGSALAFAHVFALPKGLLGQNVVRNCQSSSFLIVTGFSFSMAGLIVSLIGDKVEKVRVGPKLSVVSKTSTIPTTLIIKRLTLKDVTWLPIWLSLNLAITLAWTLNQPFQAKIFKLTRELSKTQQSTVFEHFRYDCQLSERNSVSTGLFAATICLHACLLLRAAALSAEQRSKIGRKDIKDVGNCIKTATTCLYCESLVTIAGVLIAVMNSGDGRYVQLTASAITICYCCINLSIDSDIAALCRNTAAVLCQRPNWAVNTPSLTPMVSSTGRSSTVASLSGKSAKVGRSNPGNSSKISALSIPVNE